MITINDTIFSAVVKTALDKVAGDPRWANAINRAADEIRTNPYIERGDHCLLIASPTSGNVYTPAGIECQCEAHVNFRRPCWHVACCRLVLRYDEAIAEHPKGATLQAAAEAAALLNECFA
jgi:hypothetical protein